MPNPTNDLTYPPWRKSARSGSGDNCVEVAVTFADRDAS